MPLTQRLSGTVPGWRRPFQPLLAATEILDVFLKYSFRESFSSDAWIMQKNSDGNVSCR